eukprot:2501914-Prymnesium_polylepis.1
MGRLRGVLCPCAVSLSRFLACVRGRQVPGCVVVSVNRIREWPLPCIQVVCVLVGLVEVRSLDRVGVAVGAVPGVAFLLSVWARPELDTGRTYQTDPSAH